MLILPSNGEYISRTSNSRYWGAGCGFAIIFIVSIDMLHHRTFPWNTERIPRVSSTNRITDN